MCMCVKVEHDVCIKVLYDACIHVKVLYDVCVCVLKYHMMHVYVCNVYVQYVVWIVDQSTVWCGYAHVQVKNKVVRLTCHSAIDLWWKCWAQKNWPMHTALYCLPGHQYSETKVFTSTEV